MKNAPGWLLSAFAPLALLLFPALATADEGECIQHTLQAECEVDGKVTPCDFNDLEPGTRYRVVVEADDDGELYIFTGVEDETATVEHQSIKKGKTIIPSDGWRTVPEKNPGRVDVVLHTTRLSWADDILGTMKWSEVETRLLPVVVKHMEKHGQCRKKLDEPAEDMEMERKMEKRESKSDDGARKKRRSKGKDRKDKQEKAPGVHVEPELLD